MNSLQVRGPRKGNPDAVSFHKTFSRSQGLELTEFLVLIRLGEKLPPLPCSVAGKLLPKLKNHIDQITRESGEARENSNSTCAEDDLKSSNNMEENTTLRLYTRDADPTIALWPPEDTDQTEQITEKETQTGAQAAQPDPQTTNANDPQSDSESELEILEVRSIPRLQDTDSDSHSESESGISDVSDISTLNEQLNDVLTLTTTAHSQSPNVTQTKAWQTLLPSLCKQVTARTSPPPAGYRNIPSNLVNAIQRELNLFFDTGGDDELEVVGRVIFSLKDPYSATKIRVPVKATTCRHFECFDLENFSVFHKMAPGITRGLKRELVLKSHELRKLEQLFLRQQQMISEGTLLFKAPGVIYPQFSEHGQMFFSDVYNRTPPLYKCPLCDEKFGLKQLYISDIFNFFVKTTPLSTTRIELVETDRYKILEEEVSEPHQETQEMVVLSEDEDEVKKELEEPDGNSATNRNGSSEKTERPNTANTSFSAEDFNDGLDDMLIKISQGDGTWGNPMTLD